MKTAVKIFCALFCLALAAAGAYFGLNAYVKASTQACILEPEQVESGYDCVLVLGAGIWGDQPSPMLADRLDQGIALYETGASPKLLMSGDHSREDYNEVGVMKRYAIERGVPSQDVFMDHAGFSTYESLYRAKEIFQVKKLVIVTQRYHLYRALYIAQRLGLDAVGVASDPRPYAGQAYYELRESVARCKDALFCVFWPKPTYLGDAIPVWGDGNATNDQDG